MKPEIQITITPDNLRAAMREVWTLVCRGLRAGEVVVTLGRKKRSNDQNAKLWPMLTDISRQVDWFGRKHSPGQWKDIITGSFESCEFVPGIDGQMIMLGGRTSKYSKARFSELIEYIYAFGADKQVRWSEPALKAFEQYRGANEAVKA